MLKGFEYTKNRLECEFAEDSYNLIKSIQYASEDKVAIIKIVLKENRPTKITNLKDFLGI